MNGIPEGHISYEELFNLAVKIGRKQAFREVCSMIIDWENQLEPDHQWQVSGLDGIMQAIVGEVENME